MCGKDGLGSLLCGLLGRIPLELNVLGWYLGSLIDLELDLAGFLIAVVDFQNFAASSVKGGHHLRVEMAAAVVFYKLKDLIQSPGFFVGATAGQGVEDIGQGHNPSL